MAKKLYGTDPDQVPTNADLGTIAYQDKDNVHLTGRVMVSAVNPAPFTVPNASESLEINDGSTTKLLMYADNSNAYIQASKYDGTNPGRTLIFATKQGTDGIAAESARFNVNGNLAFPSGQGIDFSATGDGSGTMTSELLDDYEEGTFIPELNFAGGTTGITYNNRGGRYTKVGNVVTIWIHFYLASKGSSSGHARIGGLPYTVTHPSGTYNTFAPMGDRGNLGTSGRGVSAYISSGNDYLPLYSGGFDGSANTEVNQTNFENITEIDIQLSYPAS